MFQDLEVYRTGDLSSPHPTKSYHWRPKGCIDEIVILSLENSYSHGPMEHAAQSCSGVVAAIGVGQMKPTLGLSIELGLMRFCMRYNTLCNVPSTPCRQIGRAWNAYSRIASCGHILANLYCALRKVLSVGKKC